MSDLDIFFDTKQPNEGEPASGSPSQKPLPPLSVELVPAEPSATQASLTQGKTEPVHALPPLIVTRSKNSPVPVTFSFRDEEGQTAAAGAGTAGTGAAAATTAATAAGTTATGTATVATATAAGMAMTSTSAAPTAVSTPFVPITPVVGQVPVTPVTPVVEADQPAQPSSSTSRAQRKDSSSRRKKPSTRRLMLIGLRDAFIAIALLAILLQFFSPTVVHEHSMEDTLKENDVLYIAKQAYLLGEPQHGDIVVFHTTLETSSGDEKSLVKRVIGLPGDHISISGGTVFRNGGALEEPYLKSGQTPGEMSEVVVPPDSYFVLGDNREVSNDSRNSAVGFVAKKQLQGKALLRIFPLSDFHVF